MTAMKGQNLTLSLRGGGCDEYGRRCWRRERGAASDDEDDARGEDRAAETASRAGRRGMRPAIGTGLDDVGVRQEAQSVRTAKNVKLATTRAAVTGASKAIGAEEKRANVSFDERDEGRLRKKNALEGVILGTRPGGRYPVSLKSLVGHLVAGRLLSARVMYARLLAGLNIT